MSSRSSSLASSWIRGSRYARSSCCSLRLRVHGERAASCEVIRAGRTGQGKRAAVGRLTGQPVGACSRPEAGRTAASPPSSRLVELVVPPAVPIGRIRDTPRSAVSDRRATPSREFRTRMQTRRKCTSFSTTGPVTMSAYRIGTIHCTGPSASLLPDAT